MFAVVRVDFIKRLNLATVGDGVIEATPPPGGAGPGHSPAAAGPGACAMSTTGKMPALAAMPAICRAAPSPASPAGAGPVQFADAISSMCSFRCLCPAFIAANSPESQSAISILVLNMSFPWFGCFRWLGWEWAALYLESGTGFLSAVLETPPN